SVSPSSHLPRALSLFLMTPPPPSSTLFPYTTLFRSALPLPTNKSLHEGLATFRVIAPCAKRFPRMEHPKSSVKLNELLPDRSARSEEHTSELQSLTNLVCRLLLQTNKQNHRNPLVTA